MVKIWLLFISTSGHTNGFYWNYQYQCSMTLTPANRMQVSIMQSDDHNWKHPGLRQGLNRQLRQKNVFQFWSLKVLVKSSQPNIAFPLLRNSTRESGHWFRQPRQRPIPLTGSQTKTWVNVMNKVKSNVAENNHRSGKYHCTAGSGPFKKF